MSNKSDAGKGDKRRPTNEKEYRSNYDLIFRRIISCDICGEPISMTDLESGNASCESSKNYHLKCIQS